MISVTILTKNSEKYLTEVLNALTSFDEVVLYDTGSEDRTLEIAEGYENVEIFKGPFEGFGMTHNKASSLAKNDWILVVDSDEVVTEDLKKEIVEIELDTKAVYSIRRNNYYNGKWIRWCGWYPDRVYRLYHRGKTRFCESRVHEAVQVEGMRHVVLRAPLNHYPYETIVDFIEKMQHYSTLFAEQNRGKKKSSLLKAMTHSFYTFFKCYILKRGFLGGKEGWIISSYNAITTYYKYLKLAEANRKD